MSDHVKGVLEGVAASADARRVWPKAANRGLVTAAVCVVLAVSLIVVPLVVLQ